MSNFVMSFAECEKRIAARFHRNLSAEISGYGDPQAYKPLREAVAAHLRSARGVNCTPVFFSKTKTRL